MLSPYKCEVFIKQAFAFIIIKYKLKTVIYLFSIFFTNCDVRIVFIYFY